MAEFFVFSFLLLLKEMRTRGEFILLYLCELMMNFFVVWLTNERRLALFPAGTIVRDQKTHYCKLDLLYVYICHGNLVPCLLVEENFDKMKL